MHAELQLQVLEQMPNPVLVKDADLRYVWVNPSFCQFFGRKAEDMVGHTDMEVFRDRQAAQCSGGDMRVLESGEVDHAEETVHQADGSASEIITRKSRITLADGRRFLVGVLHDVTQVSRLNEQLLKSEEELKRLSSLDPLTECLNRRGFREAVDGVEQDDSYAVLLLDIDHFKTINDRWGHEVGDQALQHLVTVVRSQLRPGDLMARLGGEEFSVALNNCDRDEALEVGRRIRTAIESSSFETPEELHSITASVGLVHSIDGATSIAHVLKQADQLMYEAKNAGRNCMKSASYRVAA